MLTSINNLPSLVFTYLDSGWRIAFHQTLPESTGVIVFCYQLDFDGNVIVGILTAFVGETLVTPGYQKPDLTNYPLVTPRPTIYQKLKTIITALKNSF